MRGTGRLLGTLAALAVLAGTLQAQSLGEVARKEAERRRAAVAPAGKVYTNDTLRVPPLPAADADPAGAPEAGAAASPAGAAATPAGAAVPAAAEAPAAGAAAEERGEAYWRARVQAQRDALRRAELFAEALQTRINALTSDFTARDDPAQREIIALDRQRALAELDRLREEIAGHRTAIDQTGEEARRAGAPAGWLR